MLTGDTPTVAAALDRHPCISSDAVGKSGRIHLPVSPRCNIHCRFCPRRLHPTASAPGVTRHILTPDEAARRVDVAVERCPDIAVVGIAGPGDPLASNHAETTLSLVRARHPDLVLCLSTNGLELPERVDALGKIGVQALTVTMNATEPAVLAQIVPRIVVSGGVLAGPDAAELLIARQREGIDRAVSLGLFVKINFVLVPGINDDQVGEVARIAATHGAQRINIIPLLPQAGFAGRRPPNCSEIERSRRAAERYLPVFRHCQRCRADACGIPGKTSLENDLFESLADPIHTFSHG